jgi:hypothetical protein
MIPKIGLSVFGKDHAQECPAAIRRLGATGKMPVPSKRMDAIRNIKTMAGSPGAEDREARDQRPAILRMVFSFRRPCFS